MLQRFLIGPAHGDRGGGILQLIRFALHYASLGARFAVAAAALAASTWLGWSMMIQLSWFIVVIYLSLLVVRFLADLYLLGQYGPILAAMWLPIGVIFAASYLFFVNDQGRELGRGLMDVKAVGPFVGLFFVLVYWAANSWLSARIGLARSFGDSVEKTVLFFWGPRWVGVFAHLLAALSLSLAAYHDYSLQDIARFAVFIAPVAILNAIYFGWCLDRGFFSQRSSDEERHSARQLIYIPTVVGFSLLAVLLLAFWREQVQSGFFWGTLSIAVSAFVFLGFISWLRRQKPLGTQASSAEREQDNRFEQRWTNLFTSVLALTMLIGTVVTWFFPMLVGQYFGSLIVACFCFGSFLALTNLLDMLASRLAHDAEALGFPIRPRAVWAVFMCVLISAAILTSLNHPFHRVRLCRDIDKCTPAPNGGSWSAVASLDKRPTVSKAAQAWYDQAEKVYHKFHPGKPVPMLIVATAGGGIRAAHWTATILEQLEKDLRNNNPQPIPLHDLLFAISGVSGGSVGAAAYAAAVHDHEVNDAPITPTQYLKEDFLAPGLASLVFIDGPSNVLPDFGQIDRGQALERGFEHASHGLLSNKFLSFFPEIDETGKAKAWRPILLLNATHQKTGRRIITSHVKVERHIFFDSYDALQVLGSDVRLSTAAHNSARFTYVSPAGHLLTATESRDKDYVIDGGYFENYGAETALELARAAVKTLGSKIRLVVLQISSDPALVEGQTLVRVQRSGDGSCGISTSVPDGVGGPSKDNYLQLADNDLPWLERTRIGQPSMLPQWLYEAMRSALDSLNIVNELSAPIVGILSVREAHGTIAAEQLAEFICLTKSSADRADPDKANSSADVAKTMNNNLNTEKDADRKTSIVAEPGNDAPVFSHLAMCAQIGKEGTDTVIPPLGWVISDRTRSTFVKILEICGNPGELTALEGALGLDR